MKKSKFNIGEIDMKKHTYQEPMSKGLVRRQNESERKGRLIPKFYIAFGA